VIKGALRRAALWFLFAANRLEKCGIVSASTTPTFFFFLHSPLSPETFDDILPEKGTDDVRIAHREGILAVLLGKRR